MRNKNIIILNGNYNKQEYKNIIRKGNIIIIKKMRKEYDIKAKLIRNKIIENRKNILKN